MIGQAAGFAGSYGGYYNYRYTNRQINEALSDNAASKADDKVKQTKSSTVMSDYYRENPDKRAEQESRVNEGRKLLKEAGLYPEDINNLSMDCFKDSVSRLISNIPYSSTRPFDEETVVISDTGWENMKSDPDYAAWVAGFIKEDRSAANSVSDGEDKGTYCVHNFGATPEEYRGHSFSKIFGGTAAGARTMYIAESGNDGIVTRAPRADRQPERNYNLWNTMRRSGLKRQQELLEENTQFRSQQRKQISETA